MAMTGSATVAPPAAARQSRNVVPSGTVMVLGSRTAPAIVRVLVVTTRPSAAAATLTKVSTLQHTTPTFSGIPPGGIRRPVTS